MSKSVESCVVPTALAISPIAAVTGAAALLFIYHSYRDRAKVRKRCAFLASKLGDCDGSITSLLLQAEESATERPESRCVYLDYNGTTPVHPLVLAAMIPFLSVHFGNPSSSHSFGSRPKAAVLGARRAVMGLLARPDDKEHFDENAIIFTGCGTESDNMAIRLALESNLHLFFPDEDGVEMRPHVVTSNVEHPAVAECLKLLEMRREVR